MSRIAVATCTPCCVKAPHIRCLRAPCSSPSPCVTSCSRSRSRRPRTIKGKTGASARRDRRLTEALRAAARLRRTCSDTLALAYKCVYAEKMSLLRIAPRLKSATQGDDAKLRAPSVATPETKKIMIKGRSISVAARKTLWSLSPCSRVELAAAGEDMGEGAADQAAPNISDDKHAQMPRLSSFCNATLSPAGSLQVLLWFLLWSSPAAFSSFSSSFPPLPPPDIPPHHHSVTTHSLTIYHSLTAKTPLPPHPFRHTHSPTIYHALTTPTLLLTHSLTRTHATSSSSSSSLIITHSLTTHSPHTFTHHS